jgi:aryl-alcohol dehydrogenase-like predicted oxidoreductase
VRAGKVRYVGLSNVPAWAVARACTAAELRGTTAPIALQAEYSLLARTAEGGSFGAARAFGLGVTPWSPLAGGLLSGKYSRAGAASEEGRTAAMASRADEQAFAVLDALELIGAERGASASALALAWVRQQPLVTTTLIGARTLGQLDANLASLAVELTDSQLAALDALTRPTLEYPLTELLQSVNAGARSAPAAAPPRPRRSSPSCGRARSSRRCGRRTR